MSSKNSFIDEASDTAVLLRGFVGDEFWSDWKNGLQHITIAGEQTSARIGFRDVERSQYQFLFTSGSSDRQRFEVSISSATERPHVFWGHANRQILIRLQDPRLCRTASNSERFAFAGLGLLQNPDLTAGNFLHLLTHPSQASRSIELSIYILAT